MLAHQVRVDGCFFGMRENTDGGLVWKPWRMQSRMECGVFFADTHIRFDTSLVPTMKKASAQETMARRLARGVMDYCRQQKFLVRR